MYIKITLKYNYKNSAGRNRRSLFDCVIRYTERPRGHVRLFVSTGGVTGRSNVTPVDDYKQYFARSSF